MHRTGSTTRASEEGYLMNGRSGSASAAAAGLEADQLPTYDPASEVAKKEAAKMRFAESMVHLIPVFLLLCAFLLWFFSHPDIDIVSTDEALLDRVKNMTIEGYSTSNWNSSTAVGNDVLDPIDGIGMEDPGKDSNDKDPE